MKKILALAVSVLLTSSAMANGDLKGWSAGVHGGWSHTKATPTLYLNAVMQNAVSSQKFNQGFAGAHLDWTTSVTNSWLYGLGVALGSGFSSSKEKISNSAGVKLADYEVRRQFYGEVVGRLGWNCHNKWAFYALTAVRLQNVKTTLTKTNSVTTDNSNYLWSIAPGLGAQYQFARQFSAGVEYRYSFDQNSEWDRVADRVNTNLNSHNLTARVSYHF